MNIKISLHILIWRCVGKDFNYFHVKIAIITSPFLYTHSYHVSEFLEQSLHISDDGVLSPGDDYSEHICNSEQEL